MIGSLDLRRAAAGGEPRFRPGLLAAAHGGVLYVDEINLLADHLVDVLLDVAVSGVNRVERDGVSHTAPGPLRARRLDEPGGGRAAAAAARPLRAGRRGAGPASVADRVESVRRRLEFDATGQVSGDLASAAVAMPASGAALTDDVLEAASRLALQVGAEGLRADLVLSRAAAACAALEGRDRTGIDDLRRVAPLVLAHRSRRGPFDPPVLPSDVLDNAVCRAPSTSRARTTVRARPNGR